MAITIKGMEALQHRLDNLEDMSRILGPPMVKSLAKLQDDLAKYPKKDPGAFSRLATTAQKRAYWARVRAGEIDHREGVGYVRSGTLGRKWTTQVRRKRGGIEGVLGNKTNYGPFVQGGDQQPFHRASQWKTTEQIEDDNRDAIVREFKKAIDKELRK